MDNRAANIRIAELMGWTVFLEELEYFFLPDDPAMREIDDSKAFDWPCAGLVIEEVRKRPGIQRNRFECALTTRFEIIDSGELLGVSWAGLTPAAIRDAGIEALVEA